MRDAEWRSEERLIVRVACAHCHPIVSSCDVSAPRQLISQFWPSARDSGGSGVIATQGCQGASRKCGTRYPMGDRAFSQRHFMAMAPWLMQWGFSTAMDACWQNPVRPKVAALQVNLQFRPITFDFVYSLVCSIYS